MSDLPKEWSRVTLRDFGKILSGGTPDTKDPSNWGGNIPWATPTDITSLNGKDIIRTEKTLSQRGLDNSSATLVPKNSILICTRATIGECAINKIPMATNQGFKNLIPHDHIGSEFSYYVVQFIRKEMIKKSAGSTFLEISGTDLGRIPINLPPKAQRDRIVEILSDIDAAIVLANRCLDKCKNELIALINTIIDKYNNRSSKILLGDLVQFESGFGYRSDDVLKDDIGYPLISLANFCMGGGYKKCDRKTLKKKPGKRYQINSGDLVIANTEVTRAGEIIGAPLIVPSINRDIFFSTDVSKLHVSDQILPEYLEGVLMTSNARRHMRKMSNGSTVLHLDISGASKLPIPVPRLDDQEKMISIRREARESISLRSQMITALKRQKYGLMQNLLTGKIHTP